MALYVVATANGNFTTAATWGQVDTTAILDSEAGSTALTTGNLDSATFVPAANALDGVLVKVASRATGTPTNTITITLRNSTTATNISSVTINVSDIQACDTTVRDGGWYLFKFGSTHTPNGTDSYLIRATLSATTTAVSLWTNGTANNWSRLLRRTSTAAPVAGDRIVITKEWTAAGTGTARSVTMDNTAATTFGTNTGLSTTNYQCAAINIGNGGTLTWGTTASTNYFLSLTGSIVCHAGGTWKIGDSGAEIPRTSTAIIEFVMTTSGDSRPAVVGANSVGRFYGLSRTSGKDIVWCSLNADVSAAATSISVDTDTGWKNGDTIGIASTTRTPGEAETKALSADAGASSMSVAALTNAHKGTQKVAGEVILITRNIQFRSNNTARLYPGIETSAATDLVCSWARFTNTGVAGGNITLSTTTGSITYQYCSFDEFAGGFVAPLRTASTAVTNFTINHCVFYSNGASSGNAIQISGLTSSAWTINDCVSIRNNGSIAFNFSSPLGTITNIRSSGSTSNGISLSDGTNTVIGTVNTWTAHSNTGVGIALSLSIQIGYSVSTMTSWRNGGNGITYSGNTSMMNGGRVDTWVAFGNTTTNITFTTPYGLLTGKDWVTAGDTTFSTGVGLDISTSTNTFTSLRLENPTFGGSGDTKTTHTTRDITYASGSGTCIVKLTLVGGTFLSSTTYSNTGNPQPDSFISFQRPNGALAGTKIEYPRIGTVTYETSTVQASTASQKLTPSIISAGPDTVMLRSGKKRVAVASGATVTMSVYARKDGSYNGSIQPRLTVLANPAMGINSDTVLDTLSVGANTWEQLTGTTASVSDKGVLEFVVECNGTAGNAFCDTWAAT